jgi:prophage maintenance system killer protein
MQTLGLVDLLLIAEAILGEPAERLHRTVSLWRIESALTAPFTGVGGVELYPDGAEKAAICCSRLIRNRPFPHGNREIAYLCMREMLERGGLAWRSSAGADAQIDAVIKELEAGTLSEEQFVSCVRSRVASEEGG